MSTFKTLFFVALMSALLSLSACGGGGTNVAEGGIGGTGISSGSVTGFGSIFVNGVEFETNDAEFIKDGASATEGELAVGMIVTVQGTINADGLTGTAERVTYLDVLEGPVESVTATSFVAMGQTVVVDGATQYSGGLNGLSDIDPMEVVEVSGFFTSKDNVIHATYVELTGSGDHEIKGVIDSVGVNQFTIGALIVNTADADMFEPGDFVKAEGLINGSGELDASEVTDLTKGLEIEDADEAELEGLATTACSPATPPCAFNIGFIQVNVSSSTEFEGGGLLADIQPGVRLEVEGQLVGGVIEAQEIEFEDSIELESDVVSKNVSTNELVLEYGDADITVVVDESTEIEGYAGFGDIPGSAHLKVRARFAGTTFKAVRIEDGGEGGIGADVELQAPIEDETGNTITLLGIPFDLNMLSLELKDENEETVTSLPEFMAMVAVGDVVSLKGKLVSGGEVNWQEIEIED